jgi:histidinol-phosphatase
VVERDLTADLAFARHLADVAASITLPAFGERRSVTRKPDATPVTEIDLAAERTIRAEIAAAFPDDGVLGEEEGAGPGSGSRTWIVDPLDGTKLYAEGIPLWTTLIALRDGDELVLGVADAPALGERYHASRGGGAWRDGRPIHVSDVAALESAFVAHAPLDEWIGGSRLETLLRIAGRARSTRGLSDAWGQLLVARGAADVLLEHEPCYEWDWAATSVIVEEAGGRVTTSSGERPAAGTDLLVTNGRLHDETLGLAGGRIVTGV